MTHYQKLATLIFRVIGVIILSVGVIMLILALGAALLVDPRMGIAIAAFYGPPCLIFGWAVFSLSAKLAGWVCHDFDGTDEGSHEEAQKTHEEE